MFDISYVWANAVNYEITQPLQFTMILKILNNGRKIESGIYKLFIVLVDVNIQSILSSKIVDLQLETRNLLNTL